MIVEFLTPLLAFTGLGLTQLLILIVIIVLIIRG